MDAFTADSGYVRTDYTWQQHHPHTPLTVPAMEPQAAGQQQGAGQGPKAQAGKL